MIEIEQKAVEEMADRIVKFYNYQITQSDTYELAEFLYIAGYRKQSETVKEFAEKVGEAVYDEAHIPIELKKKGGYNQFEQLAKRIKYLAEQFGKEE